MKSKKKSKKKKQPNSENRTPKKPTPEESPPEKITPEESPPEKDELAHVEGRGLEEIIPPESIPGTTPETPAAPLLEVPKKRKRGRPKGSTKKKPTPEQPVGPQGASETQLPDIKIPLANFVLNLTKRIGGKWEADKTEAKFIEDAFDLWCTIRAGWLKNAAPEIYLATAVLTYLTPRLFGEE
jgi:hypothetical protein